MAGKLSKSLNAKEVLEKIKDRFPMPSSHGTAWAQLKDEPEFLDAVLEAIAGGMSVQYFAQSVGLSPGKVTMWLNRLEGANKEQYEAARRSRAAMFADRLLAITDEVDLGTLTPPQGRVLADNMKWLAERHDPDLWGNKIQARVEMTTTVEMHLTAVAELARRIKVGDGRPVIEGETVPRRIPENDLGPDPTEPVIEKPVKKVREPRPSYRDAVADLLS